MINRSRALPIAAAMAAISLSGIGAVAANAADDTTPSATTKIAIDATSDMNHPVYWQNYLKDKGYTGVTCAKISKGFTGATWTSTKDYTLVVVKYATTNDLHWDVKAGTTLKTGSGQNVSHVIVCSGVKDGGAATPTTPTTSTTSAPVTTPPTTTSPDTTGPVTTTTPCDTDTPKPPVTTTPPVITDDCEHMGGCNNPTGPVTTSTAPANTVTVTETVTNPAVTKTVPGPKTTSTGTVTVTVTVPGKPGGLGQTNTAKPSDNGGVTPGTNGGGNNDGSNNGGTPAGGGSTVTPPLAQTGFNGAAAGAAALGMVGAGAGFLAVARRRRNS